MNPFLTNNYNGPEFFCDREAETQLLLSHIANQNNTVFFAQRRIGKTALIKHVFYLLQKKKTNCIYLDIYATRHLKDFTNDLANAIYQIFPIRKTVGKHFMESLKLLRPIISLDEVSGTPQLSLDITRTHQYEKTIVQLLQFLDTQNTKVVIAIDEFQQILNYPEKNIEALLRSAIQRLKNVQFIFCGSNQNMMHHIFNSAKRPFYASAKNIHLRRINTNVYKDFIEEIFARYKIKVDKNALELILELTCGHTYYTQCLCNEIFALHDKRINEEKVYMALRELLLSNEGVYYQYRNLLTATQWKLLKAIAVDEKVDQPYSQNFIHSHLLGTSAIVKRSLESLIAKEMIYHHTDLDKPYYEVYDKFLMRWLQRKS